METQRKTESSPATKTLIAQFLLINSEKEVVKHDKVTEAAEKFGVSKRTVERIWAAARGQMRQGEAINFVSNRLGVPKQKTVQFDVEKMKSILFTKRSTIRRLARELEINKSHVGRWVKSGVISPHTNAIKPELSITNQLHRLLFCLKSLQAQPESEIVKFKGMFNVVHIDEKWFYMSKECERYYMVPGEVEPHRTCKSKRFIPKVMFMCAVSRPVSSSDVGFDFDGKIGIWPFTTQEPAQRNSKNRLKGTLVTKPINSVTKEVIKGCLLNQIIPAIKAKWPPNASKNIFIQQDNARPHISNDDPDFRAAATTDGFNIQLVCQPPNSPDTNINDLGWFRAIQSLKVDTASYNVDDLVRNVLLSFEELSATTLNNVFLSLQSCLTEVMKVKEHNNYKIPHIGKARLIREGRLPETLEVEVSLVKECIEVLISAGKMGELKAEIPHMLSRLGY